MLTKISSTLFGRLDLIRAIAAAIVATGHLRGGYFTDYYSLQESSQNIINFSIFFITRLGIEAVVVFFVISGFLVGGSTLVEFREKRFKFPEYLIKRFSRLYVVLVPSLLIGGLFDILRINLTTNQSFSDNLTGSSDSMVISFSNQKSRLANAYGNFRSLQTRKLVA